ncbi:MAG TPA: hypothetical protein VF506_14910 [Streptosporangiaceae bacterium]
MAEVIDAMWRAVQAAGQTMQTNPWVLIGPVVVAILGWLAVDWWLDREEETTDV